MRGQAGGGPVATGRGLIGLADQRPIAPKGVADCTGAEMLERLALAAVKVFLMAVAAVLFPLIVGWVLLEALWVRFIQGERRG